MKKLVAVFLFSLIAVVSFSQNQFVSLTQPGNRDTISGHSTLVSGKAALSEGMHLYVLIHPMQTNQYWVQPTPTNINSDSTWNINGYFGNQTQGNKQNYEIIAIITRETYSKEQKFTQVPDNIASSNSIIVFRLDGH
jgi:hypothetical protein